MTSNEKRSIIASNNGHDSIGKFQYGGIAVLIFDETVYRFKQIEGDTTDLDCWIFEGKNHRYTQIISAYVTYKTEKIISI